MPAYNHFLGLTEYLLGKHEEASEHLLAALALRPDLEDYYYMGRIYMIQMHEEMAVAAFREALKINQNYRPARHNLAVMLRKRGKLEESEHGVPAAHGREPAGFPALLLCGFPAARPG